MFSELWVWGRNTHGQLGINETEERHTIPRHISQLSRIKRVSCGREHTAIVTYGGYGKLGHGDSLDLFAPKKIDMLALLTVKMAACGTEHTMALTDAGEVYSWGMNSQGRLGQSSDYLSPHVSVPRMLGRLVGTTIESIGCGGASSFALSKKPTPSLFVWGSNQFGQLGVGSTEEFLAKPTVLSLGNGIVHQAAVGESNMACVAGKGAVYVWGRNDDFRLGLKNNAKPIVNTPQLHELSASQTFARVSCGGRTTAALTIDDKLFVWQFLESSTAAQKPFTPTQITLPDRNGDAQPVMDVAVGGTCGGHTVCTTKKGEVWSWGKNNFGQTARPAVAHRKNTNRMVPVPIPFLRGASSLFCGGYHSMAIISSPIQLFFQYVRDNNSERLKAILMRGVKNVDQMEDDQTALHIACTLGYYNVVKTLISFNASSLLQDSNGQCPLHICAAQYDKEDTEKVNAKYLACLEALLYSRNVDVNSADNNHNTALHLALQCGNIPAATLLVKMDGSLDIKNNDHVTPLQFCDNPLAYQLKVLANKSDIYVAYLPEMQDFIKDLCDAVESYYMTCTYATIETDFERAIPKCSIVIFIVSSTTISSTLALSQLFLADKFKIPVFSLWKEKVKIPPNVENIVFTRQLVDFTNLEKMNESVAQLCVGLRKIIYGLSSAENEVEVAVIEDARDADEEPDLVGHYTFISYDVTDKSAAEKLKKYLGDNSVTCVLSRKYDFHQAAKEVISKKIVSCGVFLALVSDKSIKEPIVRAEVALAENHKRPMIPIFINKNIQLDPSLAYTTANLPRFFFNDDGIVELTKVIQIYQRIAASTEVLAQN